MLFHILLLDLIELHFTGPLVQKFWVCLWKASKIKREKSCGLYFVWGTMAAETFLCPGTVSNQAGCLREDIGTKKTFSFGHCPNHLNPPPLTPIRATWSSFFYAKNDVLRVWQEKKLMLIMKVAMIIMMIIMTKMTKKTYIYCEVWVKNAILRTITW